MGPVRTDVPLGLLGSKVIGSVGFPPNNLIYPIYKYCSGPPPRTWEPVILIALKVGPPSIHILFVVGGDCGSSTAFVFLGILLKGH